MTPEAPPADWLAERLAGPARAFGLDLSPTNASELARFVGLVLDWGARVNLTGARTPEALVDDHVADALACLPHLPGGAFRFIDVGSGAGFPGMVIALVRPESSGVLLEPVGKKRAFLAHAIRELGLVGRLEPSAERLEEHLRACGRGAYDVATSRAVWRAGVWLRVGAPLLRPGGTLLGVGGPEPSETPVGAVRHPYSLAGRQRTLFVLRP